MMWILTLLFVPGLADISDEARQLAFDHAPVVWLHSEEVFYPSDIDFYMENMQIRDADEVLVQAEPTPETIVTGDETGSYHMNTFNDIECVHCYEPHFFGQPLEDAKVYTLIREFNDDCNTIDISYPTFYPYNYGKDVCIGLDPSGVCIGVVETFGNHISDWEHSSIRFQNGKPREMYLAVHSFGAYYAWNETSRTYEFTRGEPLVKINPKTKREEKIDVEYPATIFLEEDNHPAVFSANGSHGTWAAEGKHTYFDLVIHLDDFTERGTPWRLWENMELYDTTLDDQEFIGNMTWINYHGKWGNIHQLECNLEPLVGECGLMSGVGGPGKHWGMGAFEDPPVC